MSTSDTEPELNPLQVLEELEERRPELNPQFKAIKRAGDEVGDFFFVRQS